MLRHAWLGLLAAGVVSAQPVTTLPPFAVNAARSNVASAPSPSSVRPFTPDELARGSALDAALRADPAFSLYRRTDSLAAHPTAQGVSLRGIGPSGASRSLVLLDGVPLNDPFGGWVQWNQIPTVALAAAEVAPGSGAGAWGNAALGGTITLVSAPVPSSAGTLRLEGGARGSWLGEFSAGADADGTALRVDARAFTTDGYVPLAAPARGAVDVPLATEHEAIQLRARRVLGPATATLTLRRFTDDRVNGTAGQRNATRQNFASLALRGASADRDWQFTVYGQDQTFRSTFTSVALDRASETPANDQFDVPATAVGATFTTEWRDAALSTSLGADVRRVRGETREDFLFSNGAFARRRFAGGTQTLAGLFAAHERPLASDWRGAVSVRADGWQLSQGTRREVDRVTGIPTRTDEFPERSGATGSANIGVAWTANSRWQFRAAAYRAFRLPTLNELYRPFRVGNINTEANPALQPESLLGTEAGADFHAGAFRATTTVFAARLADAVGNVTLASSPALVSRQRRNLDRIDTRGVETRVRWAATPNLRFDVAWLVTDSSIARSAAQPALVGKRLAQAPRQVATGSVERDLGSGWTARVQGRWTSRQFDDDENTLVLGAAGVLDLQVSGPLAPRLTLTLALDNAANAAVPTARTANGATSYAAPRMWRIGLRRDW